VIVNGGTQEGNPEGVQDADEAGADQRGEPSKAAQHPTSEAAGPANVASNAPPPRSSQSGT
jgi:hypothetical protein